MKSRLLRLFHYYLYILDTVIHGRYYLINYLNEIEKSQWLATEHIEAIQWRRFKRMLEHAYRNVPYYQQLFSEKGITPDDINSKRDISRIPILTKETVQQNLSMMTARNIRKDTLTVVWTSGSTGRPAQFVVDQLTQDMQKAASFCFRKFGGWNIGEKHAMLWGNARDLKSLNGIKESLYSSLIYRKLELPTQVLSEDLIRQYVDKLQKWKPKIVWGFAQSLHTIARYMVQHNITSIKPVTVVCMAEMLYENQRSMIETAFQCKALIQYGTNEVGPIACECLEQGGMHINMEGVMVEIMNNKKEGEILVTDLRNYAAPLIRYNLEDVGTLLKRNCSCGRGLQMMKLTSGRTLDSIKTIDGRTLNSVFFNRLFFKVIGVRRFQFIQKKANEYILKVEPEKNLDRRNVENIIEKLKETIGRDANIHLEYVDQIPGTRAGKFRYVIREIP
jgi:phenylacetate-CoA ligase